MLEIQNNDIELFEMIMISFNDQDPAEYLLIEQEAVGGSKQNKAEPHSRKGFRHEIYCRRYCLRFYLLQRSLREALMRSSASFWPLVSIDRKQALRTLHAMESFRRLRRKKLIPE